MAEQKTPKKNAKDQDRFVDALMPESDKSVARYAGVAILLGIAVSAYFSTIEFVVDEIMFEDVSSEDLTATMKIEDKKEEKKKEEKKAEKPRKKAGGGGQPRGKGNPKAPQTRGVLKLLTARTNKANFSAYTMMKDQKFAKDIDKVLKNVAGLQKSGQTVLGGRRGKADGAFNEGYAEGGSGGIGDMLGGLMGGGGGSIGTKAKGSIRTPSERDIDMGSGGGTRSVSEIMAVVKARTPGLRHIYNKFLKLRPGFSGKVTLNFTIAPGGDIISIKTVSATTGYDEFDSEIQDAVSRWRYKVIKSGNTTVTIPFSFSE
jgi:TonB family protein